MERGQSGPLWETDVLNRSIVDQRELIQVPSLWSLCLFASLPLFPLQSVPYRSVSGRPPKPANLQRGGLPTYGFYNDAQGGVMVEVSTMNIAESS
jgi:hypothetical protein